MTDLRVGCFAGLVGRIELELAADRLEDVAPFGADEYAVWSKNRNERETSQLGGVG
jgi:hypothetical protein